MTKIFQLCSGRATLGVARRFGSCDDEAGISAEQLIDHNVAIIILRKPEDHAVKVWRTKLLTSKINLQLTVAICKILKLARTILHVQFISVSFMKRIPALKLGRQLATACARMRSSVRYASSLVTVPLCELHMSVRY